MKIQDFVKQLNAYNKKIDGNFVLNTEVSVVKEYIEENLNLYNEAVEDRNKIVKENKEKEEAFVKYLLEDLGVNQWSVFKQKKRGRGWTAQTIRGDMYAHYKKVLDDIKTHVPMLPSRLDAFGNHGNRYELIYNNVTLKVSFSGKHTVEEIFKQTLFEIKKHEDSVAKSNLHLIKAKKFLDKRNEDYSGLITAKDIIELAEEMAKEAYREDRKGDIIEVQHSDGDDCEWDISYGNRCECGHNRYYLEIEGNLVDGYYSYGQWC